MLCMGYSSALASLAAPSSRHAITILGEFWHSDAVASYPEEFEHGPDEHGDYLRPYYTNLAVQFEATLEADPQRPHTFAATPEGALLSSAGEQPPFLRCGRCDMPFRASDEFCTWERPDKVSVCAIDGFGRTYFRFHGLDMLWIAGDERTRLHAADGVFVSAITAKGSEDCWRAMAQDNETWFSFDLQARRLSLVAPGLHE